MKKLKSIITLTIVALIVIFNSIPVYSAEESIVKVSVKGEVEKGNNIDIVVDLSNLKNLYSALVDYTYDNTLIKVKEIVLNEEIKKQSVMQLFGELSLNGNRARYGFTFQGSDSMGLSGDYNFVTIKAEVLKNGELDLSADKIKLQLVQKTENNMIDLPFTLSLPEKEVIEVKPTQSPGKSEQDNNSSSTNSSNDIIIGGNSENNDKKQNVTIDEDNDKIKEEPQDKNELLAEKENNDSKLDTGISSNVQENKNNSLVFFIITIIILIIGVYISFRVYKNKKIE
ncbi:MAG: cohesin domain-containing protein [Clostridium sp.]|uniref:cohesin domain-containing protein n=1 Tax=Clostridium sp. TaxID=1506 RepID=UPI0028FF28D7|nr:cohesin domain-containing protein [Clostridium sp.]MDU1311216.1 cohesin domain-containing protein [Clostridium sp.]MDU1409206.1 cohesin domain-containing protein [Clostridium sp.]